MRGGREEGEMGGEEGGLATERWANEHGDLYRRATRHPFIVSIRDGTADLNSFTRWIEQDYIFVREFVPLLASVLIKAWKESGHSNDMEVLLGGMAALNDEISWFKKEASKWGVSLVDITPRKATGNYYRFLRSLMQPEVDYTTAIVALWAIEATYQQSFSFCLEEGSNTPPELMEACLRWGNADFGRYCSSLRDIANRQLIAASADVAERAKNAFLCVLEHEVDFWEMSNSKQ